jgi:hypothetical protein
MLKTMCERMLSPKLNKAFFLMLHFRILIAVRDICFIDTILSAAKELEDTTCIKCI